MCHYHNDAMVKTLFTTITIEAYGHFTVPNVSNENIINVEIIGWYNPTCLTSHGDKWRAMDIGWNKYPTDISEGTTIKVKVWYV